jgi:cytochrome c-type biogenesis protein CcmH
MKGPRRSLILLLALLALVGAVWLYVLLSGPHSRTLDQQVYNVASQLKCPVCQHESAADSAAGIAQQMRQVIRQQLQAGLSEQEVLRYFADHYGEDILLTPPRQGFNLLAWLMPVALLLAGLGLLGFVVRTWRSGAGLPVVAGDEMVEQEALADPELAAYRAQLEHELAEDRLLPG